MSYDPNQVTTDGPYTCARKWHHAFNVILGGCCYGSVLGALLAVGADSTEASLIAALLAGPGTLLVSRVVEWVWPTDRQPLTLWQHAADAIVDGICYSAVGFLYELAAVDMYRAVAVAVLFPVAYLRLRPWARP
jgi:hypothetical protein